MSRPTLDKLLNNPLLMDQMQCDIFADALHVSRETISRIMKGETFTIVSDIKVEIKWLSENEL